MATTTTKTKPKPKTLSRGQRKHVRRVKQEERRIGLPEAPAKNVVRTPKAPAK